MPVLPMQVPVQFNPGRCSDQLLLRREAGAAGHALTPEWLKQHTDPHGAHGPALSSREAFTPTSILKVAGPEQLRQEWIASKGQRSYRAFQQFLREYAAAHGSPVSAYEANDGALH